MLRQEDAQHTLETARRPLWLEHSGQKWAQRGKVVAGCVEAWGPKEGFRFWPGNRGSHQRSVLLHKPQPQSPFLILRLHDYWGDVWLSTWLEFPDGAAMSLLIPKCLCVWLVVHVGLWLGVLRSRRWDKDLVVWEVKPGGEGVETWDREGRAANTGHISDQVTTVGTWGPIPLGNSRTSADHATRVFPLRGKEMGFYLPPPISHQLLPGVWTLWHFRLVLQGLNGLWWPERTLCKETQALAMEDIGLVVRGVQSIFKQIDDHLPIEQLRKKCLWTRNMGTTPLEFSANHQSPLETEFLLQLLVLVWPGWKVLEACPLSQEARTHHILGNWGEIRIFL